jgi:phosphoglycolate phosphatase
MCGNSSVGRALPSQGKGRGFESRFPLSKIFIKKTDCSMKRLLFMCALLVLPACFKEHPSESNKVKCIVFDFDGTLANTYPLAIQCINVLAHEYGYKVIDDNEAHTTLRDKSMYDIIRDRLGLSMYQLPLYTHKVKKIFAERLPTIEIFNGIKELLDSLATTYDIAIITSNMQEVVMSALARAQITCVKEIDSDSSLFGKHVVIKRFLKEHKLSPSELIYVGDEIRDIEACKKIGVKIVAVTWGYNSLSALCNARPDYLAHSCKKVADILGNNKTSCMRDKSSIEYPI